MVASSCIRQPIHRLAEPGELAPPAGALASTSGVGKSLAVSTGVTPAGDYTVYFSASSAIQSSQGTVTSVPRDGDDVDDSA